MTDKKLLQLALWLLETWKRSHPEDWDGVDEEICNMIRKAVVPEQKPLDPKMSKILQDNAWDLYETD